MEKPTRAGGIVVSRLHEILVVTNAMTGRLTFPKGKFKENEDLPTCAWREINEESGLTDIELVRYLGEVVRPGYSRKSKVAPSVIKRIGLYHCVTSQLELCPITPDIKEAQWVPPDKLVNALSWPQELAFFLKHRATIGV